MKKDFDVIIIGAGVAGMTSAIYLKRAGLSCCLIEKGMYGGQINLSPKVENYPGLIDVSGTELTSNMFQQVKNLGIELINSEVIKVEFSKEKKEVFLKDKTLTSDKVIIATGRRPRKLDVPNAKSLEGKGISYCAVCDGNFFREQDVVVVGGGSSAFEEALYLSKICNKVTIINRSDSLRAESYYLDRVKRADNIEILYNSKVIELNEEKGLLNSVIVLIDGKQKEILSAGCFVCIGYEPNTELFTEVNKTSDGYIIVDKNKATNISGVYAIGDVIKKDIFQLTTAISDGTIAAINCIKNID